MTTATLDAYRQLQQQIKSDISARKDEHRRQLKDARKNVAGALVQPLNLLADGDSWFDYPVPSLEHPPTDVIVSLTDLLNLNPKPLKLAHYGDATTALLGTSKRDVLISTLKDPAHAPFDAILFSGGGNDLVGDAFRFWLKDAASVGGDFTHAVNYDALSDIADIVRRAYLDLIAVRDAYGNGCYLFFHQYDYATPTNASVCEGLVGPWLQPSFVDRGWASPPVDAQFLANGRSVVAEILGYFAKMLDGLCTATNKVVVVKTQGALNPDTDWANELHPTHDGFGKIAGKFQQALQAVFGERAAVH
jgi:hypothetical protein